MDIETASSLSELGDETVDFSGADLKSLLFTAQMKALLRSEEGEHSHI